jgi:hypothetical protein
MLWRTESVSSQGDLDMGVGSAKLEFSEQVTTAFERAVLLPLMGHAVTAPLEVHAVIDQIRDKLDALASLVPHVGRNIATAQGAGSVASVGSNGASQTVTAADADDIGRNQRSRVREMVLLETLEIEHHALPLQHLTKALKDAGFEDTSSAIVSQLHRLKKVGVVDQPANGMYAMTESGLVHLRLLRRNFGPLVRR